MFGRRERVAAEKPLVVRGRVERVADDLRVEALLALDRCLQKVQEVVEGGRCNRRRAIFRLGIGTQLCREILLLRSG